MTRVVTYARVSTVKQSERGRSLEDQERAFTSGITAHSWNRVHAYAESASAKSVEGRQTFQRMIAELPETRPDLIVIHTLDRFTRNLRDGLNELHGLRGHGAKLYVLDWETPRPIDMDKDEDWRLVVSAFTRAEDENRDRARRMRTSYQGRRLRGATTTNKAPFGLDYAGDTLASNSDSWIITEIDRRYLAGDAPLAVLRWASEASGGRSWNNRSSLHEALLNRAYVAAGVRSNDVAAALTDLIDSRRSRVGTNRKHEHEFTNVFACGRCIAAGIPIEEALMGEQLGSDGHTKDRALPTLVCQRTQRLTRRHPTISVRVAKITDAWHQFIEDLSVDQEAVARWEANLERSDSRKKVRVLERQLAKMDTAEAQLRQRAAAAWDALAAKDPELEPQARRQLIDVEREEIALHAQREALHGEIARAGADRRSVVNLREALAMYALDYDGAPLRTRNMLNRALCRAIGSHPVIERLGATKWAQLRISWPAVRRKPIVVDARSAPAKVLA